MHCAQVRTGHRTQGVSLFTRMGDRFSTWDVSNGLQSLIPTLLTSGCARRALQQQSPVTGCRPCLCEAARPGLGCVWHINVAYQAGCPGAAFPDLACSMLPACLLAARVSARPSVAAVLGTRIARALPG